MNIFRKQGDKLGMRRAHKLIDHRYFAQNITAVLQNICIADKACRIAGNNNRPRRAPARGSRCQRPHLLFGAGAQFYLINVVSDYAGAVMPDMAGMALPALSEEEVLELQKDEFNEAVEPLRPLFSKAAIKPKEVCLVGNPGDEISAFAKKKKLDIIVMGSHGYGRFKAAIMGSTATRIAATGDVPLLIIRHA